MKEKETLNNTYDMKAKKIAYLRKKICHFNFYLTRDYFGRMKDKIELDKPDFLMYGLNMRDALKRKFRKSPAMLCKVSTAKACIGFDECDFAVMKRKDRKSLTLFKNCYF